MDIKTIINNLNKNTEIIESTFEKNNIQVLNYGFFGIQEDDGFMSFSLEIALIKGTELNKQVTVKINCYDEDNRIIYTGIDYLFPHDFSGYDTLWYYLEEEGIAYNTCKCRVFAV